MSASINNSKPSILDRLFGCCRKKREKITEWATKALDAHLAEAPSEWDQRFYDAFFKEDESEESTQSRSRLLGNKIILFNRR